MVDEMTNPALIEYVLSDEDATETERELAERLRYATEEIDRLVQAVNRLEVADGPNPRRPR